MRCALIAVSRNLSVIGRLGDGLSVSRFRSCRFKERYGDRNGLRLNGFAFRYVQKALQLDYAFANCLEEDADGNLTGATVRDSSSFTS